jgi:hypothetical protein
MFREKEAVVTQDKWFQLIEDGLEDIPRSISHLKTSFTQRTIIFFALIGLGLLMMIWGGENSMIAIGVFVSITGMTGIMTLSIMVHNQICL